MTKLTPEEIKRRLKEKKAKQKFRKDERIRKKREKRRAEIDAIKAKELKYKTWATAVKDRDNWYDIISNKSFKDNPSSLNACHILSKENYPELMYDVMNGVSLAFYNHKNSLISSHHDGFAFTLWLMKYRPEQYKYLAEKLKILNPGVFGEAIL